MEAIELTIAQREQMALLIGQLTTTRTVAEAFVGYFARELGINLQVYQFNADSFRFEPVGGFGTAAPSGHPGLRTVDAEAEAEVSLSGPQSAVPSPQSRNGVP